MKITELITYIKTNKKCITSFSKLFNNIYVHNIIMYYLICIITQI